MGLSSNRRLLSASSPTMLVSTMPGMAITIIIIGISGFLTHPVLGFPDGAPGEACVKHRPNHGAKSQSLDTLPYLVQASAGEYQPNDTIAVRIMGKTGVYFKGFFVQAVDEKGRWIGHFEPTPFSVSHPECAATTHHDNEEKEQATLIWHPPKDSSGSVRFMASILKNYQVYWVDAIAKAPNPGKKLER